MKMIMSKSTSKSRTGSGAPTIAVLILIFILLVIFFLIVILLLILIWFGCPSGLRMNRWAIPPTLQDKPAQVLVLRERIQSLAHVGFIDDDVLFRSI